MSFVFADPKQLWLEISPDIKTAAWQVSERIQVPGAQYQVYLNQLCIQSCLAWMRAEVAPSAIAFPDPHTAAISGELVMGSQLCIGNLKLAIIPSDAVGQDELCIPQEWVNIPAWVADYYLAAKVQPNEDWIELWGYASHHQVATQGEYDAWDRSYSLEPTQLVTDMSALWRTVEHNLTVTSTPIGQGQTITPAITPASAPTLTPSQPLATLSPTQAHQLIENLARSETAFPRLSVPFTQWGALLANQTWRQQLFIERLQALQQVLPVETRAIESVSLSQWIRQMQTGVEGAIADGWQAIDTVFSTEAQQLAFGFRHSEPQMAGQQAKIIQFGDAASQQWVRLVLLWQLENDGRLAVRAQLYPTEGEKYLPVGLRLSLFSDDGLSEAGQSLQTVEAKAANNYIQLKRFKCAADESFQLEIQLGEERIREQFVA